MAYFKEVLLPWLQEAAAQDGLPLPLLQGQDASRVLFAVQRAGEVMWVPRGWWHTVVNLEDSVAYQEQVVTKHNVRQCVATCREYFGGFARRLQKHALAGHADD